MDAFLAATNGTIKGLSLASNSFTNVTSLECANPHANAVTRVCWEDDTQIGILCAQVDRQLHVFNTLTGASDHLLTLQGGQGDVTGMDYVKHSPQHLATSVQSGHVSIWDMASSSQQSILSFQAGTECRRLRTSPHKAQHVATAGHGYENKLSIWDLQQSTEKPVFLMKNVGETELRLQVPVCVNDVQFVPDSECVVTCTSNSRIRLYDPRAQRKPVHDVVWGLDSLTALSVRPNSGQHVLVASNKGALALLDWRSRGSAVQCYKGYAGSIRDLQCHAESGLVIGCGLDRFVCAHDIHTKQLKHKIYCKSQLNCVLVKRTLTSLKRAARKANKGAAAKKFGASLNSDSSGSESDGDSEASGSDREGGHEEGGNFEEIWNGMSRVKTKSDNKKRRIEEPVDINRSKKKLKTASKEGKRGGEGEEQVLEKKKQKLEPRLMRKRKAGKGGDEQVED